MANVNSGFIHNSIWLNLYSIFYFNNNFNFLTLPTFLLFVLFILFSLKNILEYKNFLVSNYFLIVSIFYLILKFTKFQNMEPIYQQHYSFIVNILFFKIF